MRILVEEALVELLDQGQFPRGSLSVTTNTTRCWVISIDCGPFGIAGGACGGRRCWVTGIPTATEILRGQVPDRRKAG